MIVPLLGISAIVALLAIPRKKRPRRGTVIKFDAVADEAREDMPDVLSEDGISVDVDDRTWALLGDALGWGYRWGGGSPRTPWSDGARGVDCSGFVQMALVRLGLLSTDAPDRGAVELANAADPVAVGSQRPGDFAVYRGRHVMLVVSEPRAELGGHSHVMGSSGGGALVTVDGAQVRTQGYDPDAPGYVPGAGVKLFRTAKYRRDFLTYARVRA